MSRVFVSNHPDAPEPTSFPEFNDERYQCDNSQASNVGFGNIPALHELPALQSFPEVNETGCTCGKNVNNSAGQILEAGDLPEPTSFPWMLE